MFDMKNNHWRWNREPTIAGLPGPALLPIILSLYIRSWDYFYISCVVIFFYAILNKFGFTPKALLNKMLHKLRGRTISSRPFWYRKRFQGK